MKRYAGVVIAAAVLAGPLQSSADEPISITVRPVAPLGAVAQLKVLVTRDERNRSLVWEVDGPSYYRSSTMELAGADAPRAYLFLVRNLPAGEFEVRATVRRNDRSAATDRSIIRVVGGPELN